MSEGANKCKADKIAPGGEEGEVLLVDLAAEEEAEKFEPFDGVQAASSWMKRPLRQAELEQIEARGMLEGALQTLGSLEAVEQSLRERREGEAARKVDEVERAAQEKQRRLHEVKAAALAQSAELPGAGTTTWKLEVPATMVPREHVWTLEDLDFARVRMDEVPFVDALDEEFEMGGVGEATFEYVCDAASGVNVVDEADEAGMPARVFEANACLAEFGRTHDDFERHVVWMLNAVATMTMVAADGRASKIACAKAIRVGCSTWGT
ncbi:hypothetical protein DYB32_002237 [Aphanomyces invadans]|uniref:Uncharacterized protein n=1 Tax=Aphanomyces invadans TaxID=157072 RepID=A0A3R6VQS2_9STRA|nr:hypothetical protein DYB32_002237 [Aphanomyces invadans]